MDLITVKLFMSLGVVADYIFSVLIYPVSAFDRQGKRAMKMIHAYAVLSTCSLKTEAVTKYI